MTVSELRFRTPGTRFYAQGLSLSAVGFALIAWGAIVVAFDPWNWAGPIILLGGVYVGVLGVVLTLLVWFIYVWGTITTWRHFRQLRPPAVVMDASGVRYLAPRRPVFVPWPDVERVGLRRIIFRNRVVTKVFLRLTPDAGLLRDGTVAVPASRSVNVGLLSELEVPEDIAMRFLEETVGSRLEVTIDDRRKPAASYGR